MTEKQKEISRLRDALLDIATLPRKDYLPPSHFYWEARKIAIEALGLTNAS
jgi:hypothetical protein